MEVVREVRLVVIYLPLDRLGVRVKENLRRITAVTVLGIKGAVDTEAVALPRANAW